MGVKAISKTKLNTWPLRDESCSLHMLRCKDNFPLKKSAKLRKSWAFSSKAIYCAREGINKA